MTGYSHPRNHTRLFRRKTPWIFPFLVLLFWILSQSQGLSAQRSHTVYFEGCENELHVYRIKGDRPGKTLLIVGGIQGDEPGGFLAADFYADFFLETGNLIVVPRANFPSILKNERQINQDMNRKFMNDDTDNYEASVVTILKKLICESDCFLNLHEGSGIYSPKWENENRNPKRFGQSIIADDTHLVTDNSTQGIDLKAMALQVIPKINTNISDPRLHFHFNNHRTEANDSLHKEQRKSATYYAMKVCKIPGFGIESAKALPLNQKVRQHIDAINGFMELLGIIPQTPGLDLKKPQMQYMIISVNGSLPVVVEKMQHLGIRKGDTIEVMDIVANYQRGLSADIIGAGNEFNDLKKKIQILEPTRIVAKKDFYPCGSVFLDFIDTPIQEAVQITSSAKKEIPFQYKLKINGQTRMAKDREHIMLYRGDTMIIEDIVGSKLDPSAYVVNLKGFVGNTSRNTGEDRGYLIDTGKNVFMTRYSVHKKGQQYLIKTTLKDKEISRLYIHINKQVSLTTSQKEVSSDKKE